MLGKNWFSWTFLNTFLPVRSGWAIIVSILPPLLINATTPKFEPISSFDGFPYTSY